MFILYKLDDPQSSRVLFSSYFSPTFGLHTATSWCLKLYPKSINEKSVDYISLFVKYVRGHTDLLAKAEFSLINSRKEFHITRKTPYHVFSTGDDWGYSEYLMRMVLTTQRKTELLNSDQSFKIFACVIIIGDSSSSIIHEEKNTIVKIWGDTHLVLIDYHEFLYEVPRRLNHPIYIARSPVFAAMFSHPMLENQNSTIKITDLQPETIRYLLEYIYTSNIEDINEHNAIEIFKAADKYRFEYLKQKTELIMINSLSISNSIMLFIIANLHNAIELKKHILNFIMHNIIEITETDDWRILVEQNPILATEAFVYAAEHATSCACSS